MKAVNTVHPESSPERGFCKGNVAIQWQILADVTVIPIKTAA